MFGGDDVGALVADVGSTLTKFGFAGEDIPKAVFDTTVGVTAGEVPPGAGSSDGSSSDRMTDDADEAGAVAAQSSVSSAATSLPPSEEEDRRSPVHRRGKGNRRHRPPSSRDQKQFWAGRTQSHQRAQTRPDMASESPIQYGVVQDWDAVEAIWEYGLEFLMNIPVHEHPVVVSDPLYQTPKDRARLCEMLFETFDVPATFLCKSAVLSAFSQGKSTALVVDCGGHQTTVVPVHDGFHLNAQALRTNAVSGRVLDGLLWDLMFSPSPDSDQGSPTPLKPVYQAQMEHLQRQNRKGARQQRNSTDAELKVSPTFHLWKQLQVVEDLKHTLCRVSEAPFDPVQGANVPVLFYELPDGTQLRLGPQRFQPSEQFFLPQEQLPELVHRIVPSFLSGDAAAGPLQELSQVGNKRNQFQVQKQQQQQQQQQQQSGGGAGQFEFSGLPNMIFQSISNCDVDLWKDLYMNILAVGGSSLLPGLTTRLKSEMEVLLSSGNKALRVKVITHNSSKNERQFGPWIGGSILGSLGSFHQMWFSRQEYDERGADFVAKKCPG